MQELIIQDLPKISPAVRKASVKILTDFGYSTRKIAVLLGLTKSTVQNLKMADVSEIEPSIMDEVGQRIKELIRIKEDQIISKMLKKMEDKVDKENIPFGSLAFAYKAIKESQNPKGQTNVNLNAPSMNVQVVRGNVSYNVKSGDKKPISEAS